MVLLNPTFDVYITRINTKKYSILAASEKAKRPLQSYFKANDFVHTLEAADFKRFKKYCTKSKLTIYVNDTVRHRD